MVLIVDGKPAESLNCADIAVHSSIRKAAADFLLRDHTSISSSAFVRVIQGEFAVLDGTSARTYAAGSDQVGTLSYLRAKTIKVDSIDG